MPETMRLAAFTLAVAGLVTGIVAASVWSSSAKVEVAAPYPADGIPPGPEVENQGWTVGLLVASSQAAALNMKAARWTAVSVLFNGAAAVLGTWPF